MKRICPSCGAAAAERSLNELRCWGCLTIWRRASSSQMWMGEPIPSRYEMSRRDTARKETERKLTGLWGTLKSIAKALLNVGAPMIKPLPFKAEEQKRPLHERLQEAIAHAHKEAEQHAAYVDQVWKDGLKVALVTDPDCTFLLDLDWVEEMRTELLPPDLFHVSADFKVEDYNANHDERI